MHHRGASDTYRFCPKCGIGLESKALKDGEPSRLVCPGCDFIFYLDPKVAACTICMVDGGIVLLKRGIEPQMGKWVFPGGFVDRGEQVADAAVRETLEEVNLRVGVSGILDAYSFPGSPVVVIVYAAEVLGGELMAGDESLEVRVFAPEDLPWDDLAFESTRAALRDYVRRFFPRVHLPRQSQG
jgi:ADP-ribose pyrophosphatase YjhB (NUDIX family)